MSRTTRLLEAGALLPARTKADPASAETLAARTYRHAALGDRPVVRLVSERLTQAEDLAMEFFGFRAEGVSRRIAVQARRSLGFAAWALVNDPDNAYYALGLVKRMKAAARKARSKPGHAWDAYEEMARELGRCAPHFLPPFWEEAGRTFKELGNQTYAGRALNKSLEAERVHALPSDRARRRDVVLEFVLAGCPRQSVPPLERAVGAKHFVHAIVALSDGQAELFVQEPRCHKQVWRLQGCEGESAGMDWQAGRVQPRWPATNADGVSWSRYPPRLGDSESERRTATPVDRSWRNQRDTNLLLRRMHSQAGNGTISNCGNPGTGERLVRLSDLDDVSPRVCNPHESGRPPSDPVTPTSGQPC